MVDRIIEVANQSSKRTWTNICTKKLSGFNAFDFIYKGNRLGPGGKFVLHSV